VCLHGGNLLIFGGVKRKIVILGNGIAGITAARNIRIKDAEAEILVISAESKYFFSRTALMYVYMGHMEFSHIKPYEDFFWKKNRIDLLHALISSVSFDDKCLYTADGHTVNYDVLILATGSKPVFYDWPGQDAKGVQGLYSKQDLELMIDSTRHSRKAVIVGGGLIGIEMAEMLHSRSISVTLLVKDAWFWGNILPRAEGEIIRQHLENHGIEVRYSTRLKEIIVKKDEVAGVVCDNNALIDCDFVGIATGVAPNIEFLRDTSLSTNKGILVNRQLQTNIPDVYAIGDCSEQIEPLPHRRAIEPVWYTGRMMGEVVASVICGEKAAYMPGPWFNSAKFFDIEYQTYGIISTPANSQHRSIFWRDVDANRLLRLEYYSDSDEISGINALGIRLRHQVCQDWLEKKLTVDKVIAELPKAWFDAELTPHFFPKAIAHFNNLYYASRN
jgi:NAD(P)H-nitrite reductase large subunit